MVDPFRRNYGAGGDYTNTSNNRIKDNLAAAHNLLLDEPQYSYERPSGVAPYGGIPSGLNIAQHKSQPPMSGYTKSNYTASEVGDYEGIETNSQFQRRKQWGNPDNGGDNDMFGGGFKSSGGGDLAGLAEIPTLNEGGASRRGSFRAPSNERPTTRAGRGESESKERMREQSATSIGFGFGNNAQSRPMQSFDQQNQFSRRPQTQDQAFTGASGQYNIGSKLNNQYSEAASSYKGDEDDHLSQFGQSEFGGASNLGVGSGIPTLDRGPSNIPSRRMAQKQQTNDKQPTSTTSGSKPAASQNYGLFLQEDQNKRPPSQDLRRQGLNSGNSLNDNNRSVSPPVRDQPIGFGRPQTGQNQLVRDRSAVQQDSLLGRARDNSLDQQPNNMQLMRPFSSIPGTSTSLMGMDNQAVVRDEKREREMYVQQKKREEIQRLEGELRQERDKVRQIETEFEKQIQVLKEKNVQDLESIEQSQQLTLTLLLSEKEKTLETLQDAIAREKNKMEVLHEADLQSKERQHLIQLEMQRKAMEKDTQHLESQLSQQAAMRSQLDSLHTKTSDLSDIVQTNLKNREDEIKRREIEMAQKERMILEEEAFEVEIQSKKVEEEERRLQRLRDDLLKNKAHFSEELERLREMRRQQRLVNDQEVMKQKQEERQAKDSLMVQKQKLEVEMEKRKTKQRINEIEIQNKENEVDNFKNRLQKEQQDFEQDFRERHIREIQIAQIKTEERREILAQKEQELIKKHRFMEKKMELIKSDWEEFQNKVALFESEKRDFQDWATKIKETSLRLSEERDKVQTDKAEYDYQREQLEKWKMDLELQRSILQSEYIRAEELEHELDHREKMLQMLKFNREQQKTEINIPPYSSCPALKVDPRSFAGQQQMNHSHFEVDHGQYPHYHQAYNSQNDFYPPVQVLQQAQYPQNVDQSYSGSIPQQDMSYQQVPHQRRFNYEEYVKDLQQKLGNDSVFRQRQGFEQQIGGDIEQFRKDMSMGYHNSGTDNDVSMGQINAHKSASHLRDPTNPHGYGTESINQSQEYGNRQGMATTESLRAQIQRRLGNAQLSESKQYEEASYGVEEQDHEEDSQTNNNKDYVSEY